MSRRSPGEGGTYAYETAKGTRFYWKASIHRADGSTKITVKRGFLSRKAALASMREALAKSDQGTFIEPSQMLLREWIADWQTTLKGRVAGSTEEQYRRMHAHYIAPYLGGVTLAKLTAARIEGHYRWLAESGRRRQITGDQALSPRTLAAIHTALKVCLQAAVENEPPLLAVNPAGRLAKKLPDPRQDVEEVVSWTQPQLEAFLSWADVNCPGDAVLWRFLAFTGCRRGEALGLRWCDVAADHVQIKQQLRADMKIAPIKNKKGKVMSRRVDTGYGSVDQLLRDHKAARGKVSFTLIRSDALVFADDEGKPLPPKVAATNRFWRALARYRKTLADPPPEITLHGLRHTHCSILLEGGMPPKIVAERTGHTTAVLLSVYSHVIPGSQGNWIAAAESRRLTATAEATTTASGE